MTADRIPLADLEAIIAKALVPAIYRLTLAAHLSRLIAADLTTGTPPAALTPYTPARFTPGALRTRPAIQ